MIALVRDPRNLLYFRLKSKITTPSTPISSLPCTETSLTPGLTEVEVRSKTEVKDPRFLPPQFDSTVQGGRGRKTTRVSPEPLRLVPELSLQTEDRLPSQTPTREIGTGPQGLFGPHRRMWSRNRCSVQGSGLRPVGLFLGRDLWSGLPEVVGAISFGVGGLGLS